MEVYSDDLKYLLEYKSLTIFLSSPTTIWTAAEKKTMRDLITEEKIL